MFKYAVTFLGLLLTTTASSQFATPEWSAHFSDWSCYVMRSAGPLTVGTVDRVEVIIGFYAPRMVDDDRQLDPLEDAEPVKLQVQVVPPFPSWHLFKEPRVAVAVMKDQSAVPLKLDSSADLMHKPFVLDGDVAAQIWSDLRKGQGMELVIRYAENNVTNLRMTSEQVPIAAAMMDSCIEESRRGQRE